MMEENENENPISNIHIVGINITILAVYTLACRFTDIGLLFDAFFIMVHFIVCIIVTITSDKKIWAFTGLVVLLIGVSTCVEFLAN
jgi:hypothetical protein